MKKKYSIIFAVVFPIFTNAAELDNYNTAELDNYNTAEPDNYNAAQPDNYKTVRPDNYKVCSPNVTGKVTGLYSDNWDKKLAIKISNNPATSKDGFYYLSWSSVDANIRATYKTASAAYISGAKITIKECQGDHINSIQIE